MLYLRQACALINIGILLILASCGGSQQTPDAGQAGQQQAALQSDAKVEDNSVDGLLEVLMQPQLPLADGLRGVSIAAPQQLLGRLDAQFDAKTTLCAWSGWFIEGAAYQDGLPNSNVSRDGVELTEGLYSPSYDGMALESGSYAIYRWNLRGYSGEQTIGFSWVPDMAPEDAGNWYIGLANLQDDRWEFFEGPDDNVLSISSFGPYRSATGDVLLAFVLLGSTEAALAHMEAGVPEKRATGELGLPETAPDFPLLAKASVLPAAVDLSAECAPVNDQMQWGACTAFAVGDSAYNHELGQVYGAYGWNLQSPANRVSPKYLYIKSGELGGFPASGDYGRYTDEVIDNLMNYGTATDANAPYDMVYDNNWSSAALEDAKVLKIESWREVPCNTDDGIDTVKRILAEQGKVLPMRVNLDITFPSLLPGQVWYYTWGTIGGHAMCIVGYDDSKGASGAFKVRNSWGRFWGDKGYCWIAYESFRNPYAFIRCYTMTEDYGTDVVDRFGLNAPAIPPVSGLSATQGTEEGGIHLAWDAYSGGGALHVMRDSIGNEVAVLDPSETEWLDDTVSDPYGHVYWVQADGAQSSPAVTGYIAALPQVLEVLPLEGISDEGLSIGASVTGSGPMSFVWDFGLGATPASSIQQRPYITLKNPGTYGGTLTVSNAIGSDEFSFQYTVLPQPVLIDHVYGTSGYSGDQAIIGIVSDGPPQGYSWDFGDACTPSTSTDGEPFVTYGAPGVYEATVTITNLVGEDTLNFLIAVLDPTETKWSQPGFDSRRSRQSPLVGPQDNSRRWRFMASYPEVNVNSSHVMDVLELPSGDLIVPCSTNGNGNKLFRITPAGAVVWKNEYPFPLKGYLTQPVSSADGAKLYLTSGRSVYCLDSADGAEIWRNDGDFSESYHVLLENANGEVYVVRNGRWLGVFDGEDGSQLGEEFVLSDRNGSVANAVLAPNGTLFISTEFNHEDRLVSFDTVENVPLHSIFMPQLVRGMAISPDGLTIYTLDDQCDTRAFDTNTCNMVWWQKGTRGAFSFNRNAPAVMADGTVVVANQGGKVSALDPATGAIIWDYDLELDPDCRSTPAIGRDGTVYFGGCDTRLYAVKEGALVWQSDPAGTLYFSGSPTIASDGTLYCGSDNGMLWAFGTGSDELFYPAYVNSVSPLSGTPGSMQTFMADVAGSGVISYQWDFDGGATPDKPTDAAPEVTLGLPGTYDCKLTVSNELGNHTFDFELVVGS